jgi:hypothetical protein
MLESLFGNSNAEKVLLHIYHYGEIHAAAIASDYGVAVNPVKRQLERFENGGILAAKTVGRSRIYFFNAKSPWVTPLMEILKIAYASIPLQERQKLFGERRRPRKRGKEIIR